MISYLRQTLFGSLLIGFGLYGPLAWSDSLIGRVVGVGDGDTVTVIDADQRKVTLRLAGIDAPEKSQDFGLEAKQALMQLCLDKPMLAEVRTTDRYGRLVARLSCNEVDVAASMLEKGLAWHFSRYAAAQPGLEAQLDLSAQNRAKIARVGLWSTAEPVAPWDWRTRQRDLK